MLIRFTVENFLSFDEPVSLNMGATKITRHPSHVIKANGERILKGALLFGANASGKTNFTRAMDFAAKMVRQGLDNLNIEGKYFRLHRNNLQRPGRFVFDLRVKDHFYTYGFSISYAKKEILEEYLFQDFQKMIFHRFTDLNGEQFVEKDLAFSSRREEARFGVYREDICKEEMRSSLFLDDVAKRTRGAEGFAIFQAVRYWFNKLHLVYPDQQYFSPLIIESNPEKRKFLEAMLAYLDTGIESLSSREEDLDKLLADMAQPIRNRIKIDLLKRLNYKNSEALLQLNGLLLEVCQRNSRLYARKLLINHGNSDFPFEFEDESDGTKRLFDLIPLLADSLN